MSHQEKTLCQLIAYLKDGLNGVVLLRHAHRESIPAQSFGNQIPISAQGHNEAIKWGNAFQSIPYDSITSSPVLRCLQTANCIQNGFQKEITLKTSTLLGNPGVFICDQKEAEQSFLTSTVTELLKNLISGDPPRGIRSVSEGVLHFLNEFCFKQRKLHLLISHDVIIAPICCYLFDSIDIDTYMPGFLEAVLIFYDEEYLYCYFKGNEKVINREKFITDHHVNSY